MSAQDTRWAGYCRVLILAALMRMFAIGRDGRPASLLRVPRRLHWRLWLLAELDQRAGPLDG